MPFDSAELATLQDSVLATRFIQAAYRSTSSAQFESLVNAIVPDAVETYWSTTPPDGPNVAYVIEEDGTLWVISSGILSPGKLLGAITGSEPLDVEPGDYLVFPQVGFSAQWLEAVIVPILQAHEVEHLRFVGHSMGGAVVSFLAVLLGDQSLLVGDTTIITFGAMKPGSANVAARLQSFTITRWQEQYDPIPLIPPSTGLMTLLLFAFPFSKLFGLQVGYKQAGGGRLFTPNGQSWTAFDFDWGLFNLLALNAWFWEGKFPWLARHSINNYRERVEGLLANYSPQSGLTSPVVPFTGDTDDTGRNKEAMSTTLPAGSVLFVRIFGTMGGQGWSCNFYTGTLNYGTALAKGQAVATAMLQAMSQDASIIAITASNPGVQGDSDDLLVNQPGALNSSSFQYVGSSPPNLAARIMLKSNFKSRRVWWVHGLSTNMLKAGNTWVPVSCLSTGLNSFVNALLGSGGTGLVTTGSGIYTQQLIVGTKLAPVNLLGIVTAIAANPGGGVLVTLDRPSGLTTNTNILVQLKGRAPLYTLRGRWTIQPPASANQVILNAVLPLNLNYVKGASLCNVLYQYVMPDSIYLDGIATHRTGSPYGRLRGRRARSQ